MAGNIRSRHVLQQIFNIGTMKWKTPSNGIITPMDVDYFLELYDLGFVVAEAKYKGTPLPTGQRLAYERLHRAIRAGGKECLTVVCEHNVSCTIDECPDIEIDDCMVRKFMFNDGGWDTISTPTEFREIVNRFELHLRDEGITP